MRTAVWVLATTIVCLSLDAQEKSRTYKIVTSPLDSATTAKLKSKVHFKTDGEVSTGWSKLRKGMSFEQVDSLLGTPRSCDYTTDHFVCYWRYNRGELRFNNTAKTLSSWDK